MALHHSILDPELRWFPADEVLRESSYEKLLPPLVHQLRNKVNEWRTAGYEGAAETSISLLIWRVKMALLKQRCLDINRVQSEVKYDYS